MAPTNEATNPKSRGRPAGLSGGRISANQLRLLYEIFQQKPLDLEKAQWETIAAAVGAPHWKAAKDRFTYMMKDIKKAVTDSDSKGTKSTQSTAAEKKNGGEEELEPEPKGAAMVELPVEAEKEMESEPTAGKGEDEVMLESEPEPEPWMEFVSW